MRFMVLMSANKESEAGVLPDQNAIAEMGRFNEALVKAGVLLAADALHASSKGVRIRFSPNGRPVVADGPFPDAKELIAGFWMVQLKSKEEAIEWFSRCPAAVGEIELRQVLDAADFEPVPGCGESRAAMHAEAPFQQCANI